MNSGRAQDQPAPSGPPEVHSITGAASAHSDDLDTRIRRYLISMGIRTICVILALVVGWPWRWVFIVGAVGLPYIAVVMANVAGDRGRTSVPTVDAQPLTGLGGGDPAERTMSGETVSANTYRYPAGTDPDADLPLGAGRTWTVTDLTVTDLTVTDLTNADRAAEGPGGNTPGGGGQNDHTARRGPNRSGHPVPGETLEAGESSERLNQSSGERTA